jgi:hypothetical protein
MVPPNRRKIVEWTNTAWDELPARVIVSGFQKTKLLFNHVDTIGCDEITEDPEYSDPLDRLEGMNLVEEIVGPDVDAFE